MDDQHANIQPGSPQAKPKKAPDAAMARTLGRTGMAALSLAAVCKAGPVRADEKRPGAQILVPASKPVAERKVFVANDALAPVAEPEGATARETEQFTLAKLSAFQKPPLEEHLIEPAGSGGTCACNTVCSCVPVQTCSCNTVCTCHTVETCAAYSSGGGGGGGGYGGYYVPCW